MNKKLLKQVLGQDGIRASVYGLFIYKEYAQGEESILNFVKDYCKKAADFNLCYGSYHVAIELQDKRKLCFDDNAGMMRSFINIKAATISYSLSEAINVNGFEVDYNAIAQILYFGCTYDLHTIVKGIRISNPDKYYIILPKENKIQVKDKSLTAFEDIISTGNELEKHMKRLKNAFSDSDEIGCVITGGMDSRSVLSHLIYQEMNPRLFIADSSEAIDIEIARKIAKTLQTNITVIAKDNTQTDNRAEIAINESGGMFGAISIFMLAMKARYLKNNNIAIECGGVAGEMYKNSFINQDYPFYFGKVNWNRFYKYKVAPWEFPDELLGDLLRDKIKNIKEYTILHIKRSGKTKYDAYLNAGYFLLQSRFAPIGAMQQRYYVPYNPLLERDVAAYAFGMNPYRNEMQRFQRMQVSKYCPQIKDILTDRGISCNIDKIKAEKAASIFYMFKVYIDRLIYRNNVQVRTNVTDQLNIKDKEFVSAFKKCKEMSIISNEITFDNVPFVIKDRLFSVGGFLNRFG